jgi:hypothetical protein
MSEEKEKLPKSNLSGSLARNTSGKVGPLAVSSLRGSLATRSEKEKAKPSLAPDDYNLPELVAEKIDEIASNESLTPFEDPEGVIVPGRLFSSSTDPSRRRLITNVYSTPNGNVVAKVHIEGAGGLRNLSINDLQERINNGLLLPPEVTK